MVSLLLFTIYISFCYYLGFATQQLATHIEIRAQKKLPILRLILVVISVSISFLIGFNLADYL